MASHSGRSVCMVLPILLSLSLLTGGVRASLNRNALARTPPMGWMSWQMFRCDVVCEPDDPNTMCIDESLYMAQADALAKGGYIEAGYTGIHMDDCWEEMHPPRDPKTGRLQPNATRFPSGLKALGDYIHSKGATFGLYTAESPMTCAGYPASAKSETLDAKTFAGWGVDYMKVDGCGNKDYYASGYKAMGEALRASGRDIVYSCSWPAYINDGNESKQPFATYINYGCNLWRNWDDIQCSWGSLSSIIEHWGMYGEELVPYAGPGHWHDMDMLLVGANCLTEDEERTQMAIWSISASPLIMGNDLRNVSATSAQILLNEHAIAISQDPLGQMGRRLNATKSPTQLWARNLANGDVAVALYNAATAPSVLPPFENSSKVAWTQTTQGYYEACGGAAGNVGQFKGLTVDAAQQMCGHNVNCAGFSFNDGGGFFKGNANCGFLKSAIYEGYTRTKAIPSGGGVAADITVDFGKDLQKFGALDVFDIWTGKSAGIFKGTYTAKQVPPHGTAFVRLSKMKDL